MWVLWAVIGRLEGQAVRRGWSEDRPADQEAMRRVARGEGAALAELYDRHARAVFSLAVRILGDQAEAEDIVQDVFSQAWSQASRYDASRGAVGAWLLTMARSRAIDRVRARRARPESRGVDARMLGAIADLGARQDVALLTAEQVVRLRAALERLPLLQRIAIELAYYEGLTQAEIAERLEQPIGTVKTRVRLALLKLREAMAGSQP